MCGVPECLEYCERRSTARTANGQECWTPFQPCCCCVRDCGVLDRRSCAAASWIPELPTACRKSERDGTDDRRAPLPDRRIEYESCYGRRRTKSWRADSDSRGLPRHRRTDRWYAYRDARAIPVVPDRHA